MRTYRGRIFESNSSNTQCLAVITKDEFEDWKSSDKFLYIENLRYGYAEYMGTLEDLAREQVGKSFLFTPEEAKGFLKAQKNHIIDSNGSGNALDDYIERLNEAIEGTISKDDYECLMENLAFHDLFTFKYFEQYMKEGGDRGWGFDKIEEHFDNLIKDDVEYKDMIAIGYEGYD